MIDLMLPYAKRIYTVNLPDENRTLDAKSLEKAILECAEARQNAVGKEREQCVDVLAVGDIESAVRLAFANAEEEDVILAFGSLSYLGKVIEIVK